MHKVCMWQQSYQQSRRLPLRPSVSTPQDIPEVLPEGTSVRGKVSGIGIGPSVKDGNHSGSIVLLHRSNQGSVCLLLLDSPIGELDRNSQQAANQKEHHQANRASALHRRTSPGTLAARSFRAGRSCPCP